MEFSRGGIGMFAKRLQYKLSEVFESEYLKEIQPLGTICLNEGTDTGRMELIVHLKNLGILIENFDKKKRCEFLLRKSGYYGKCADYALFELIEEDKYKLHIFELTTTVGVMKWVYKIKPQVKSAYLNCLAIAACLEIQVVDTMFYTVFENDEFDLFKDSESYSTDIALLKGGFDNARLTPKYEWENGISRLNFGNYKNFAHTKIQVAKSTNTYPTGIFSL